MKFLIILMLFTFPLGAAVADENRLVGEKSGIKKGEPEEDARWEQAWEKLCAYDDFCHRLKNPKDSSWLNPERLHMEIMKNYRADILKASKIYDIDPRAIVGAFLADLVIIPTHESEIHEYLVNQKILPKSKQSAAHFPLGLVYDVAAQPVEALAAQIEKRKIRAEEEVSDLLQTPVGTIYYGAAVIRDAQDRYRAHGIDISKRPDILSTLYNLGKVEDKAVALEKRIKKAQEMRNQGATPEDLAKAGIPSDLLAPRPNFFGLFLNKNIDIIEGILDPKKEPQKMKPRSNMDCKAERASLQSEYAAVSNFKKMFLEKYPQALERATKILKKKIESNAAFLAVIGDSPAETKEKKSALMAGLAAEIKASREAKDFCPLGMMWEESARFGQFQCSNSSGGFVVKINNIQFDDDENMTPSISVCRIERESLRANAYVKAGICLTNDLDKKDAPPASSNFWMNRYGGRDTFYGKEGFAVPADSSRYIAYALPLDCVLTEAAVMKEDSLDSSAVSPAY